MRFREGVHISLVIQHPKVRVVRGHIWLRLLAAPDKWSGSHLSCLCALEVRGSDPGRGWHHHAIIAPGSSHWVEAFVREDLLILSVYLV